jgi:hypothetical protein
MEQLSFLNKLLIDFGIKGLSDYETKISQSELSNDIINKVNNSIPEIKKLFKTSSMNLARKKYKIDSIGLALSILKHCLKQANVPYETIHTKTNNCLRLIPVNRLLVEYIEHPMNTILHHDEENTSSKNDNIFMPFDLSKLLDGQNIEFVANTTNESNISSALMHLITPRVKYHGDNFQSDTPIERIFDLDAVKFKNVQKISDLEFIITPKNIIISVQLPKYSEIYMDLKYQLIDNVVYLDSTKVIEKTKVILGNTKGIILCNDIADISKNIFSPMCAPSFGMKIMLYLKRNTNIKNICVELDSVECLLNQKLRNKLKYNKQFIYMNEVIIDHDYQGILKRNDDFEIECKKNTYQYVLKNNAHSFSHDLNNITNIKLGIVDSSNGYNFVDNYISYAKINIGENKIYEQMFEPKKTNLIDIGIKNIPIIGLRYNEVVIKINTFYDLKPNHMLILQFMRGPEIICDINEPFKYMDGIVQNGQYTI